MSKTNYNWPRPRPRTTNNVKFDICSTRTNVKKIKNRPGPRTTKVKFDVCSTRTNVKKRCPRV